MGTNPKLILTLVAGFVAGAAGMETLHAQQGIQRTEIQKADLTGVAGNEVIMGADRAEDRHVHPQRA